MTVTARRIAFFTAAVLLLLQSAPAQTIRSMEFRNQPVTDILMVLADVAGKSIVPDETVSGTASYYFTETGFDEAFHVFLSTYKLYAREDRGVIYVSRIRAEYDRGTGTVSMDAEDVPLELAVRSLSRTIGKTVLYDTLPRAQVTLHLIAVTPEKALSVMVAQHAEYRLETDADFFYLRRVPAGAAAASAPEAKRDLVAQAEDGTFSLTIDRARFLEVLDELFRKTGREYSLFLRADLMLENMRFSGKTFDETLRLILEQAGGDWTVANGIYYIFEIQKRDILKKLKETVRLPLTYLSVQDLPNLFPQELAGQNFFRLDKPTNSVILSGSVEEIAPIEAFIRAMDRPLSGLSYCRFDLAHQKVKDVLPLIPQKYAGFNPQAVPNANAFIALLSPEAREELERFLSLVDRTPETVPVHLKYIKSETLLKNLPPSVTKEEIVETGDPRTVFFIGPASKRERFLQDLTVLDRPVPQIRYDLLVVQYERGGGTQWNTGTGDGITAEPLKDSAKNAIVAGIGNLLSLNFDIVSTFGYQFALNFSAKLTENSARVLADTTLNGLSGEEIKFQNTTTNRYRDFEIDPDTGKQKSTGVTREITSGLIISMNGWTSGDGMITMKVSATVSRTGAATNNGQNPPTTFEKVVQTNVRAPSGSPVVIGGLIQSHTDVTVSKVPVLGDIPLLGLLFRTKTETVSDTEFVIYIVPRLEDPERRARSDAERIASLYERFVRPSVERSGEP
jgi:general secretion pathway protein D